MSQSPVTALRRSYRISKDRSQRNLVEDLTKKYWRALGVNNETYGREAMDGLIEALKGDDEIAIREILRAACDGTNICAYEHFLESRGQQALPETHPKWASREGLRIWKAIEIRLTTGMEEGELLNPLLHHLFQWVEHGYARASGTDAKHPDIPMGAALEEVAHRLAKWVENASIEELETMEPEDNVTYFHGLLAQRSKHLADPDATLELLPSVSKDLSAALDNPNLSPETLDVLLEIAVDRIIGALPGNEESSAQFWSKVADKGTVLPKRLMTRLWAITQLASTAGGDAMARQCTLISAIRQAVEDKRIRKVLISLAANGGYTHAFIAMAKNCQGEAWTEVAKAMTENADDDYKPIVAEFLNETSDWSLQGVNRAQLVALVQSENALFRAAGHKLMTRVASTRKAGETKRGR